MSRRTYHLEPQRLAVGKGYVPCEPHQACRFVIIETTSVPGKHGRRPYHIKRNLSVFSGSGAMLRARLELDTLTRGTNPRPQQRGVWGTSLTRREYDLVQSGRKLFSRGE